jgi:putative ABC transport system substrate-binding protein
MRRREFIAVLGTAAAWPLGAQGQQAVRRIGVLLGFGENDPASKVSISAFTRGLAEFGWTDGGNVRMDVRLAAGDVDRMQMFAKELVGFKPDVILTHTTPATGAVQRETQTIPIVFVNVADPVGSGYVASLPLPGGNLTGFAQWEPTIAGKWVELLTEIVPGVKRIATIFNPETAPYVRSFFLPSFAATTRAFKVESIVIPIHGSAEIETIINSLGREPRSGLVVMPDTFTDLHRTLIISLAARNNVPAVYPYPYFPKEGGLLSYGTDYMDIFRRSASYIDRILRDVKPGDLPVQLPVVFRMIINNKTAKALVLDLPASLLARADEVIE